MSNSSLDWFKGKPTGKPGLYHQTQGVSCKFSLQIYTQCLSAGRWQVEGHEEFAEQQRYRCSAAFVDFYGGFSTHFMRIDHWKYRDLTANNIYIYIHDDIVGGLVLIWHDLTKEYLWFHQCRRVFRVFENDYCNGKKYDEPLTNEFRGIPHFLETPKVV